MVLISLQIIAVLDEILELSASHKNFIWHVKYQCTNCKVVSPHFQQLCQDKPISCSTGKGIIHHLSKCRVCKKEIRISILAAGMCAYNAEDSGTFKNIATFDCRGADLVEYQFGNSWIAKSMISQFDDVDLSEDYGDWSEWDDREKKVVSISNAQYKFQKAHK